MSLVPGTPARISLAKELNYFADLLNIHWEATEHFSDFVFNLVFDVCLIQFLLIVE